MPWTDEHIARRSSWAAYHRATRTATYGFLSALPLLVLYEVMIIQVNASRPEQIRIGAEVWLKQLLALVGGTGLFLGAMIGFFGAYILIYERKKRIPLRWRYFLALLAESALYAVVVAGLVSSVVGILFAAAPLAQAAAPLDLWTRLALSIGAGVYEELFFRVLLVGGLYWGLRRFEVEQRRAYVVAAVIGALLFSAVHYIGALGDPFALSTFTFRFLFGLALNVLFLLRGFGVAAWTHALYDVMLVTGFLG